MEDSTMDKVRKNLTTGITRVKWMANFVAERTKAGTSSAKLLYEISKLENRIDDLYRRIGRRITELKEKNETEGKDVFRDHIIEEALEEVKKLKETADNYRSKAGV
ncbi:MAG: hypothetical protein GXP46_05265 [Deferribacteres bacterium]|nr:hypothetical protein [Deferribacteres bacterium]